MDNPEHPFASYVRTLGKGKSGSRSLTEEEATHAMSLILNGDVEDVQLGAFLMLLRVKEESPEEISGFVKASRAYIKTKQNKTIHADLDWSSYAGKRTQPHWFILAALLLATNGYKVFMHGAKGHTEGRLYTQQVFETFNWPVATHWNDVASQLEQHNMSFMPIEYLCPPLHKLIQLRPLFGLRSPVHTLCRLLNPLAAPTTLQSVFHPSYASTHHQAAILLGENNTAVFKGDAGEVEYRPQANIDIKIIHKGIGSIVNIPRVCSTKEQPGCDPQLIAALWMGETGLGKTVDNFSEQAVLGTTAIALFAMGETKSYLEALKRSQQLWQTRNKQIMKT